jgi:CRP-like cAMP-binding protein
MVARSYAYRENEAKLACPPLYSRGEAGLGSALLGGVSAPASGVDEMSASIRLGTTLLGAGVVSAWLAPLAMFVLVIVASWLGLRWIRSEHLEALRAAPLFSLLSDRELRTVLRSAHAEQFPSGATVIREHEQGKGFFVVTDGTATVMLDGTQLATLGPGSYFGEMAVIDGGPRTATIAAQTQVSTLVISPRAFTRLIDREPMIAQSIYLELSRRLKEAGSTVGETVGRVDRAHLVELSSLLRRTQQRDWAQVEPGRRRSLRLSKLFARGS